jgi:nucleotidyltransferase substrate binding protein (TIGR01987 family)
MIEQLRWMQRYESFCKALAQLESAVSRKQLDQLQRAGVIQTFGFTWELAWKTMQDLLRHQGHETTGPRDVLKQGFKIGLITEDPTWLNMLESRNMMAHVYDEDQSAEMANLIRDRFFPLLKQLSDTLAQKR